MIKNYSEQLVEEILPEVLNEDSSNMCRCQQCCNDIKGIALNNLKPLYFDTNMGGLYSKLKSYEMQYKVDVIREINKSYRYCSS